MRNKHCIAARNVLLIVSGILAALPLAAESVDSQSSAVLTASLSATSIPVPLQSISLSGSDLIMKTDGSGYPGGRPTVLMLVRADGTSQSIATDNEVWGAIRSGQLLRTLEVANRPPGERRGQRTFRVQEYDLQTGDVRTLKQAQPDGIESIHLLDDTLYLITRDDDVPATKGILMFTGSALSIRTLPLNADQQETSLFVSTRQIGPIGTVRIRRFRPYADSLYCYVTRDKPPHAIYRLRFGSEQFEKLVDVEGLNDFCIVPDGPWLAYVCSIRTTPTRYTFNLLPLDGSRQTPITGEFDPGEVRFWRGLQYDPTDRSFIIRGNTPPYRPRNRLLYRIDVDILGN